MNATMLFAVLIIMFLTAPLITLIHELGHALAGLSIGASHVTAQLGGPPRSTKTVVALDVGRLRIQFTSWRTLWFGFAWMDDSPPVTAHQRAWVLLAGPLTSLVMTLLLAAIAFVTRRDTTPLISAVLQYTAFFAFVQLLMTAIPMRYPAWMGAYAGHNNDMARAIKFLRQEEH